MSSLRGNQGYFCCAQEAKTWRGDSRCEGYRIDTLMWTDGGRDFNNVGYVSRKGELVVFADLFPNTKYGYNGRLFQVSTLHVSTVKYISLVSV